MGDNRIEADGIDRRQRGSFRPAFPGHYWLAPLLALLLALPLPLSAEEALMMGVFPRRSATLTSQLFTPLADYLSEQLGRPVKLVTAKDFPTFWEGVEAQRFDIVHYNQYHYTESADHYLVVASNEEQGHADIRGALYVRKDSGITEVSQLKGKRVIFGGGADAMMSHIVPHYLLHRGGLKDGEFEPVFASSPPNAVLAVYFGQADAGGAGDVVMNLPVVKKSANTDELAYLAVSEPIKHLPWTVRKDLPEALQARIRELLVGLGESERGREILKAARLTGMSPASDSDYDTTRAIAREVLQNRMNGSGKGE